MAPWLGRLAPDAVPPLGPSCAHRRTLFVERSQRVLLEMDVPERIAQVLAPILGAVGADAVGRAYARNMGVATTQLWIRRLVMLSFVHCKLALGRS
jgi:hypothetical protein